MDSSVGESRPVADLQPGPPEVTRRVLGRRVGPRTAAMNGNKRFSTIRTSAMLPYGSRGVRSRERARSLASEEERGAAQRISARKSLKKHERSIWILLRRPWILLRQTWKLLGPAWISLRTGFAIVARAGSTARAGVALRLRPGVTDRRLGMGGRAVLVRGSRALRLLGLGKPAFEPGRQERLEPGGDAAVVLEPAAEMLWAAECAGPGQAIGAAMGPPAHHVIGDLGVELEGDRVAAVAIGLVGEILAARGEELRSRRQVEPVGMPLIDGAREPRPAQRLARGRRLDRVVADLAALVVVAEHSRAERAGQHLRAEADAEGGLGLGERRLEPVDLAPDPVERVVRTHRAAEYDDPGVIGERLGQRLAKARPANVEPDVHGPEHRADPAGGRMLLVQHDQNGPPPGEARHGHDLVNSISTGARRLDRFAIVSNEA